MPRVGFEPTISAGERPKTYALDRAATGIGRLNGVSLILHDDHKERVMGRKCKPNESESHKRDVGVNDFNTILVRVRLGTRTKFSLIWI